MVYGCDIGYFMPKRPVSKENDSKKTFSELFRFQPLCTSVILVLFIYSVLLKLFE